jgi:hypothetical protein
MSTPRISRPPVAVTPVATTTARDTTLAEGVVSDMDVGGIQERLRERDMAEGAVPERGDAFVEPGTDP